jgi:hypothetical protein
MVVGVKNGRDPRIPARHSLESGNQLVAVTRNTAVYQKETIAGGEGHDVGTASIDDEESVGHAANAAGGRLRLLSTASEGRCPQGEHSRHRAFE